MDKIPLKVGFSSRLFKFWLKQIEIPTIQPHVEGMRQLIRKDNGLPLCKNILEKYREKILKIKKIYGRT